MTEQREALERIVTPLLAANGKVFVAFCPENRTYIGTNPAKECLTCKIVHDNHVVTRISDLDRLVP